MHGTRPLTRLVLVLALGLFVAAGAESEPEAAPGPAGKPGGIEPSAAAVAQASPQAPAEPDPAQIDAWLAAARALKAERPELFGEAEGVLATEVLADGQGAAAGIEPGDVLLAYGDTTLGSAGQLVELTGETPAQQTVGLRWMRLAGTGAVRRLDGQVQGGRIGVVIQDVAESPVVRMQVLWDAGVAALTDGRHQDALNQLQRGLDLAGQEGNELWRAGFLRLIGTVLDYLGSYTEAIRHFNEALAIDRKIGDRGGEGKDHAGLGIAYDGLHRYPDALKHSTQALAISQAIGDRQIEGVARGVLGAVCDRLGRYPAALEHLTQNVAIQRETGSRAGEAAALVNLGVVYLSLGRYPDALEHFTQALAIAREIGARAKEGLALNNLGFVYESRGRYPEALEHHTQALAIHREIGDRAGEANDLTGLGNVYCNLGRYPEALGHHTEALAIRREIADREGEGKDFTGLGNIYQDLGRYPEALEHHTQALAIDREIGDRKGEGSDLGNLGTVYRRLGRNPEALEHCTRALAIFREIGHRAGEGLLLNNLGGVYQRLGRYPDALEHFAQALAIAREIGDRAGEGPALGNLGVVYGSLGRYPEALEHYTQALAIRREIDDRAGESRDLGNLGALQADEGHIPEALSHYHQALSLQAELNRPETLWRLWNDLRELWEKESKPAPAILAGKRAINQIQSMRVGNASLAPEQQQSFLADKDYVYRRLADLLISQGRHAESQQVLDMLKEQELYDYIKEEGAHDPRQTRVGLNAMESDWSQAYDAAAEPAPALAQKLGELTRIKPDVRTDAEQAEIARLTAERDQRDAELQRQLAALPERLAAVEPARQAAENTRFAQAPDAKPAVLAALSQRSGSRTGLLQFILLPNKVRILLTTPDGWETDVVEVPAATLATEIETLRSALTDPTQDAQPPAKALYGRLVAPLAEEIDAAKLQSLLVHLDGRLRYVPFAALHDGQQWLAERWPIVYYTAASERRPELAAQEWRVAGLGVSEGRKGFEPLPTVVAEIDGIVREAADDEGVLPGRVLLNADFSESALRQQAANADNRILHVASHFSLRPGNDADSSLLLGTVATDGAPDRLSLRALREAEPRLDLRHLDLVTLSACETAMGGADASGAEIEGMGAIIQRQGAHGVLASLWPVADRSTGTLMQTFYRLRAERPELTKAQALQQAQLGLLHGTLDRPAAGRKAGVAPGADCAVARRPVSLSGKGGKPYQPPADPACRWSHPYYWAPFVLMGNWL